MGSRSTECIQDIAIYIQAYRASAIYGIPIHGDIPTKESQLQCFYTLCLTFVYGVQKLHMCRITHTCEELQFFPLLLLMFHFREFNNHLCFILFQKRSKKNRRFPFHRCKILQQLGNVQHLDCNSIFCKLLILNIQIANF